MKKLLAILLVLSFAFALVACGGGGDTASTPPEGSEVSPNVDIPDFETGEISINKDELPRFKIAFGYGNWESVLGMQFKQSIEYLCEAFNCEPVFFNGGGGSEEGIANTESLLAAGDIDGLIAVSWDTAAMAVADKYGVPVVTACQFPSEQEIAGVASYDLFLGGVVDDEIWAGYQSAKALYEAGCRNVTFSGLTPGYAKGLDDRYTGYKQFIDETSDMNLIAEGFSLGLFAEDIPTFVAAFPEMDGMCFATMSDSVYNNMETEGIADGSVKIAGPDVASMTGDYFEKGIQVWSCGGQYATAMMSWAVLYNYLLDGTVIISNPSEPISRSYLEITSYEDFQNYVKYVEAATPVYTAQEIAEMIHYFNKDVTLDDYVKSGEVYSLEDIIARQSK